MRALLIGGHGLLGTAFRDRAPAGVTLVAPTRLELDLTDEVAVRAALDAARPDWVINCAAFTAVDAAETQAAEAQRVNATAVATLGRLAAPRGTRVLQPSTDYVFDGAASAPYREDAPTAPLSAYARSKRDGELALQASGAPSVIVRSGWLYGRGGRNLPATLWQRARARTESRVVNDQTGTPTFADDLAGWCWTLMARDVRGIVHLSNAGAATWFEVAQAVYRAAGWAEGVHPTTSAEFAAAAPRPRYSVLDCSRFDALASGARRPWREALTAYLQALAGERAA